MQGKTDAQILAETTTCEGARAFSAAVTTCIICNFAALASVRSTRGGTLQLGMGATFEKKEMAQNLQASYENGLSPWGAVQVAGFP